MGVQVIHQVSASPSGAWRSRNPKTGVWAPAVMLPDELAAAIAQEVQCMLLRRPGPVAQERSRSEGSGTGLDQLFEHSMPTREG